MSQEEFRQLCVLSGTDYNIHANGDKSNIHLDQTLKLFNKYKHQTGISMSFYTWLNQNTDYISDNDLLVKINDMFDLKNYNCNLELFKKLKIMNGPVRRDCIDYIMKDEGFIFV